MHLRGLRILGKEEVTPVRKEVLLQKRCGRLGYKPEVGDAKTRALCKRRDTHASPSFAPQRSTAPGGAAVDCSPTTMQKLTGPTTLSLSGYCVPSLRKALSPQQPEDGAAILPLGEKGLRSKGRSLDCKRGGLDLSAERRAPWPSGCTEPPTLRALGSHGGTARSPRCLQRCHYLLLPPKQSFC